LALRSSISVSRMPARRGTTMGMIVKWWKNASISALASIDMVGAGQASRGEQHNQEQGGHGEADDDRRKHQRLGNRVGIVGRGVGAVQNRRGEAFEPAHAEDEQVDRVGEQRQPDDDLKAAWPQQQPHAGAGQYADADGENAFHQLVPALSVEGSVTAGRSLAGLAPRIDWWAIATRISTVAPTTSTNTPRS